MHNDCAQLLSKTLDLLEFCANEDRGLIKKKAEKVRKGEKRVAIYALPRSSLTKMPCV